MNARLKHIELFATMDQKIVDQNGEEIDIETARVMWDYGMVSNFNLSFQRLATRANWDFAELARQYAEMDAHRCR